MNDSVNQKPERGTESAESNSVRNSLGNLAADLQSGNEVRANSPVKTSFEQHLPGLELTGSDSDSGPDQLKNTTIILMRHAEKPNDPNNPDLTSSGYARADALASWIPQQLGRNPDYIFAAADSNSSSRPRETVEPLSQSSHVDIDSSIKNEDYDQLAEELNNSSYDGKDIVIAWHHGNIPQLAESLGAAPSELAQALRLPAGLEDIHWPGNDYDDALRLDYGPGGDLKVTGLRENINVAATN